MLNVLVEPVTAARAGCSRLGKWLIACFLDVRSRRDLFRLHAAIGQDREGVDFSEVDHRVR
jgi:hypothetical protein